MSNPNTHICPICGKEYLHCDKCKKYGGYRALACSPEHFQFHIFIEEYRNGVITSEEFLDGIKRLNLLSDSNILDSIRNLVKEIQDGVQKVSDGKKSKTAISTK